MEKKRVAMVLYTHGIEYDDRIRKEIVTITKHCPEVEFEIFAITPENKEVEGISDYGVKYHLVKLNSREKYSSATHIYRKTYDFYKTVYPKVKDFDVIWCADIHTFIFAAFHSSKKPFIWDLHELPGKFMNRKLTRVLFKYLTTRCVLMYHANQPRIDYLNKINMLSKSTPQVAIRNYPNRDLAQGETEPFEKLEEFKTWRKGRKCIYLQGASEMTRRPIESACAILESPEYCGVVVGGFPKEALEFISGKYGAELVEQKLFFAGRVPQVQTKNFIAECTMGLVFYQTCVMNNTYCEPNRLFQTIMMGRPVIVGCNPPKKEIIDKYGAGIALKTDGSDIEEIKCAIAEIDSNYGLYQAKAKATGEHITWESQEDLLVSTFRKALNI